MTARDASRHASSPLHRGVSEASSLIAVVGVEAEMKNLILGTLTFVRDDSGQDLLEYALLVALIALVAVAAVTTSGQAVNSIFTAVATQLQQAAQAGGA